MLVVATTISLYKHGTVFALALDVAGFGAAKAASISTPRICTSMPKSRASACTLAAAFIRISARLCAAARRRALNFPLADGGESGDRMSSEGMSIASVRNAG